MFLKVYKTWILKRIGAFCMKEKKSHFMLCDFIFKYLRFFAVLSEDYLQTPSINAINVNKSIISEWQNAIF